VESIEIYTDGACRGNPGQGGWGAILSIQTAQGLHKKELFGGEANTTNNRMELTAVIRAIEAIKRPCQVAVYTDSMYVQRGMTTGFRKKRIKNADLWEILNKIVQGHQIDCYWVKGHSGNEGNERADALANRGMHSLACNTKIILTS